jgi:hypothetical protein
MQQVLVLVPVPNAVQVLELVLKLLTIQLVLVPVLRLTAVQELEA